MEKADLERIAILVRIAIKELSQVSRLPKGYDRYCTEYIKRHYPDETTDDIHDAVKQAMKLLNMFECE